MKRLPGMVAICAVCSLSAGTLLGATLPAQPDTFVFTRSSVSVTTRTMSVYSDSYIGKKMANGKPYDAKALTVASNDWPLGTRLTIVRSGKSVEVEVTDRMHKRFTGIRVDASRAVWNALTGSAADGLRKVEVQKGG